MPPLSSPAGSARLPIDIRRFSWIRPLAADYAFAHAKLAAMELGVNRRSGLKRYALRSTLVGADLHFAELDDPRAGKRGEDGMVPTWFSCVRFDEKL